MCAPYPQKELLSVLIGLMTEKRPTWAIHIFSNPKRQAHFDLSALERLPLILPPPRFEGYQARQLQVQKAFKPDRRGWWLGTSYHSVTGSGVMTMKMSVRFLQEYLAGKIGKEEFDSRVQLGGGRNAFEHFLEKGMTVSDIRFEPAGLDEDDDSVVFEFSEDAAASEFRPRQQ